MSLLGMKQVAEIRLKIFQKIFFKDRGWNDSEGARRTAAEPALRQAEAPTYDLFAANTVPMQACPPESSTSQPYKSCICYGKHTKNV